MYKFVHTPDNDRYPTVTVDFDDTKHPFAADAIGAFYQFLTGAGFHPDSLNKYIDIEKVMEWQTEAMKFEAEHDK